MRTRTEEDYVRCETCEQALTLADARDRDHCPRGECGAGPRCAAHRCLCERRALLAVPCACGHERREHHDNGNPGSYDGICDYSACLCSAYRLGDLVQVEVAEEPGTAGTGARCPWGEFRADNDGADGLASEIEAELLAGREYRGGGGAAPMFVVRIAVQS